MKAVLEFQYPEDEDRLRHALHGSTAIFALDEVRRLIRSWHKHDAGDYEELLDVINKTVCDALTECGEE
jgi:hypothetical protein